MASVETYKSNVIEITVTQPTPTYNVSISADKTSAYTGEVINFTVTGDTPAPPWDLHVINGSGVEVKSDTVSGDFSLKFSIADTYSVYLTGDNGKFESNRVSITVTEAEVISIASTEEGREEEVSEGEEGGIFGFGVRQRLRDRLDKLRQRLFGSEEGSETARTRGL